MWTRDEVAERLEDAGWPAVAADVRAGVPTDTILSRLYSIGEAYSTAAQIVAQGV